MLLSGQGFWKALCQMYLFSGGFRKADERLSVAAHLRKSLISASGEMKTNVLIVGHDRGRWTISSTLDWSSIPRKRGQVRVSSCWNRVWAVALAAMTHRVRTLKSDSRAKNLRYFQSSQFHTSWLRPDAGVLC